MVTYQVVQLDGVDTLVDTRDDLLRDSSSINVIRVEAITKPRHTGSDLVELHAFFASVCEKIALVFILTSVARPGIMQDCCRTRRPAASATKLQLHGLNKLTSLVNEHLGKCEEGRGGENRLEQRGIKN
jgi:hypothetical protein